MKNGRQTPFFVGWENLRGGGAFATVDYLMNIYVKKRNPLWRVAIPSAATVVALIFLLNFFSSPLRNYFYLAASPVAGRFWAAGAEGSRLLSRVGVPGGLQQQNDALQEENQKLQAEVANLQALLMRNQVGQQAQAIALANNFTLVPVQVVGLDDLHGSITINKGSADGIAENMPVISAEKIVYGRVINVYKNFSEVMLISSEKSVLDVKIQQDDPTRPPVYGAVKGGGNFSGYLDLVDTNAPLAAGSVLVTSALGGIFPPDLPLGKVLSVDRNDAKPFQTARLQLFLDRQHIDTLMVITNYLRQK